MNPGEECGAAEPACRQGAGQIADRQRVHNG